MVWKIARSGSLRRWMSKRVAVAMSGGVDSSVAASILKEQGYDCIGVFMRNWDGADESGGEHCPIDADFVDMKEVCNTLNIPSFEVSFAKEYWTEVFEPFLDIYQQGVATPNPDVYCNRLIKFSLFKNLVKEKFGIHTMATGHYARLASGGDSPVLLRGVDSSKDQSYFLSMTKGEDLRNVLFPVGELSKAAVKDMAQQRFPGHRILTKRESMGICFIGKRPFDQFLEQYVCMTQGRFINVDNGKCLGYHSGMQKFTVGQSAAIPSQAVKFFVASKSPSWAPIVSAVCANRPKTVSIMSNEDRGSGPQMVFRRIPRRVPSMQSTRSLELIPPYYHQKGDVFVCGGRDHPALSVRRVYIEKSKFSWIAGVEPEASNQSAELTCECRYDHRVLNCTVSWQDEGEIVVELHQPCFSLCPGQILVLYNGEVCLGGGPICKLGPSQFETEHQVLSITE